AIVAEEKVTVPDNVVLIMVQDTTRVLAAISATYYQFPTTDLSLIGVTGTNGNTTTTYMLESIFQRYGELTGLMVTKQAKIGGNILTIYNTTPDALELQKVFYQKQEKKVKTAMMVVSAHDIDVGSVNGYPYDKPCFTNK